MQARACSLPSLLPRHVSSAPCSRAAHRQLGKLPVNFSTASPTVHAEATQLLHDLLIK